MNKTEAVMVNTLLRWVLGDPEQPVEDESARYCAAQLAKRSHAVLSAGVTPAWVENTWDELRPTVVRGRACPHSCGPLDWVDDMWHCPGCGDEFAPDEETSCPTG